MEVRDLTPQRDGANDLWTIGDKKITGSTLRAIRSDPDKEKCIRFLAKQGWDEYEIEVALHLSEADEVLDYESGDGDA